MRQAIVQLDGMSKPRRCVILLKHGIIVAGSKKLDSTWQNNGMWGVANRMTQRFGEPLLLHLRRRRAIDPPLDTRVAKCLGRLHIETLPDWASRKLC